MLLLPAGGLMSLLPFTRKVYGIEEHLSGIPKVLKRSGLKSSRAISSLPDPGGIKPRTNKAFESCQVRRVGLPGLVTRRFTGVECITVAQSWRKSSFESYAGRFFTSRNKGGIETPRN
ncbi:hypothetical protein TWF173_007017 [Orbilia oligospora]|nr:hypothetical protein TWF173_007017 [Orbilia oligospora]